MRNCTDMETKHMFILIWLLFGNDPVYYRPDDTKQDGWGWD